MNKIYDYTSLSLTELIEKISTARFFHLPKMVAEAFRKIQLLIPSPQEPAYKVYTALLTQSSTNAPIPVVLENTTNLNITYRYVSSGKYDILFDIPTNKDKVSMQIGQPRFVSTLGESATASYEFVDDNSNTGSYQLLTKQTINSTGVTTLQNNYLFRNLIEIKIYK